MDKSLELKGHWWLPETPEIRVSGVLSFSPGELPSLELMGTLTKLEKPNPSHEDFINPPIILGISLQGEPVTLEKCAQIQSTGTLVGISTSKFTGYFAYVGVHFPDEKQVKFRGLSVAFYNLDEWFCQGAFTTTSPKPESEVVTYERPNSVKTVIGDYHIDFVILGPNASTDRFTYVKISQEARINIWSGVERCMDDFLPLIRHLQNFLTLGMSTPTFITEVIGNTERAKDEELNVYHEVKIHYPADPMKPNQIDVPSFFMTFTLPTIKEQLENALQSWISKAKLIKPVYDLYFSALYNPSIYQEFEFLSLAQAVETYHRQVYGGKFQPDEIFQEGLYKVLVAAIPKDIPKDFRSSLEQGKLKYANEFSFRKRLQLLGEHLGKNLNINFLSDKKLINHFAEKVADTRNYFTHYPPELEQKAAKGGKELHDLIQQLRLVLQICFLEELGFKFDKIAEIFKKNREYRSYFS